MSDLLTSPVGDSEPVVSPEPTITDPTIISKLRDEIKGLRAQVKQAEPVLAKYKELEDAQKSEAQRLSDQLAAANKLAADNLAAAQQAQREAQVTRLATRAGVDLDLVAYLDLSKLDLTDEKAALEVLGKLATKSATASSASNPGRTGAAGADDAELRKIFFGGGRNQPTIFGGK
jgi:hypothetical protein